MSSPRTSSHKVSAGCLAKLQCWHAYLIRYRVPGQPGFCNVWGVHCRLGCLQCKPPRLFPTLFNSHEQREPGFSTCVCADITGNINLTGWWRHTVDVQISSICCRGRLFTLSSGYPVWMDVTPYLWPHLLLFSSSTACFPFPLYLSLAENQTGVPSGQQGVGVSEVSTSALLVVQMCGFMCHCKGLVNGCHGRSLP